MTKKIINKEKSQKKDTNPITDIFEPSKGGLLNMGDNEKEAIQDLVDEEIMAYMRKAQKYNEELDENLTFKITVTVQVTSTHKVALEIQRKTDVKNHTELTENQKDKVITIVGKMLDLNEDLDNE